MENGGSGGMGEVWRGIGEGVENVEERVKERRGMYKKSTEFTTNISFTHRLFISFPSHILTALQHPSVN